MLILILAGIGWTLYDNSLPVAVLTAALIYYRAHRPSAFRGRLREAWYQARVREVGEE